MQSEELHIVSWVVWYVHNGARPGRQVGTAVQTTGLTVKRRYEKNVSDAKPAKIMSKEMKQLRATSGKKKLASANFVMVTISLKRIVRMMKIRM